MASERILIVDDEEGMRRLLSRVLTREGYDTSTVSSGAEALRLVANERFDLVVTDIKMPEMDGLQLLEELKEYEPSLPIIVITAYGTIENAVQALRSGAYDYIAKPFENDEIKLTVAKAFERERLLAENRYLHAELEGRYDFSGIIGGSPAMQQVYEMASSVAVSNANVLITGESGTGKELLARSIHYSSQRKDKPFVVLNCAALSEGVLESELFGHEKGAFSGALDTRKGRFERADQGTLFIDEVAEMTMSAQVKLLRVAGHSGARVRAGWRQQDDRRRCAHRGCDQQDFGRPGQRWQVPGRPLLSPQCCKHQRSASTLAPRRC
jgi:DNA-binding NtrC family response regulator